MGVKRLDYRARLFDKGVIWQGIKMTRSNMTLTCQGSKNCSQQEVVIVYRAPPHPLQINLDSKNVISLLCLTHISVIDPLSSLVHSKFTFVVWVGNLTFSWVRWNVGPLPYKLCTGENFPHVCQLFPIRQYMNPIQEKNKCTHAYHDNKKRKNLQLLKKELWRQNSKIPPTNISSIYSLLSKQKN